MSLLLFSCSEFVSDAVWLAEERETVFFLPSA